ncbi:MAG TPA: VOC family protein [Roseomonas sp.]|jgi:hypothetical protein
MNDTHGRFCWYELLTTDPDAAQAFYTQVVGWNARDSGMPGMNYTIFGVGEAGIGGMMKLTEECAVVGARTGWVGYVAVEDVDAHAQKVADAGGAIRMPPQDIPGIGRFAVVADPQGAVLTLFKPAPGSPEPQIPPMGTPGPARWRELYADDWQAAFGFYAPLFNWTKGDALDMGAMGTYQIYGRGEEMFGGMMNRPPNVPAAFWLYYFETGNIDEAKARIEAGGGQVVHGPSEVPGNAWIVQAIDPQGGMFGLVGTR